MFAHQMCPHLSQFPLQKSFLPIKVYYGVQTRRLSANSAYLGRQQFFGTVGCAKLLVTAMVVPWGIQHISKLFHRRNIRAFAPVFQHPVQQKMKLFLWKLRRMSHFADLVYGHEKCPAAAPPNTSGS